jgi:hypothetical protein
MFATLFELREDILEVKTSARYHSNIIYKTFPTVSDLQQPAKYEKRLDRTTPFLFSIFGFDFT